MKFKKRYKDDSYYYFDYDLYNEINNSKRKREYTLDDLNYPMYKRIRDLYFKSPWHRISKFRYKDHDCKATGITFVYDTGFVLRLNYEFIHNGVLHQKYRYIHNLNSQKFLKLLKLNDIKVLEYQ